MLTAAGGAASFYVAKEGYDKAFGEYVPTEGSQVLASFAQPTQSFASEKGKEVVVDGLTTVAGYGAAKVAGAGLNALSKTPIGKKVIGLTEELAEGLTKKFVFKTKIGPNPVVSAQTGAGTNATNPLPNPGGGGSIASNKTAQALLPNEAVGTGAEIASVVKKKKVISKADGPRYQPGKVEGGENLQYINDGDRWFRGTENNVAKIPAQIADKMRGMEFKNFAQMRNQFWKLVAQDPILSKNFSKYDINNMNQGLAAAVSKSQVVGKFKSYQLHHITPIQKGGDVYNFDNLFITTPKYHGIVLDPKYHYGLKK